jgi:hypothetical protein
MKFNADDLVEQGLVVKKSYPEKGLHLYKYHNKVFYNNLWHLDERLLECRGIVVDNDYNIVVWPFTKVFNLGENGTSIDDNQAVVAVPKINGFLGVVTWYGDEFIVSTTGSLYSSYVDLARKYLEPVKDKFPKDFSFMFEICDPSDPHIVEEDQGAYIIGMRDLESGVVTTYSPLCFKYLKRMLDHPLIKCKVDSSIRGEFGDIKDQLLSSEKEGYMICKEGTDEVLCKLKTPHYLSKKAIMRLGKGKIDLMYTNTKEFIKRVDEEFYNLVYNIVENVDIEIWKGYTEQQRRTYIEEYFKC